MNLELLNMPAVCEAQSAINLSTTACDTTYVYSLGGFWFGGAELPLAMITD